ncbi:MAG: hypothetical protein MK208_19465 [Shimia sp.]|uniref:hypothetical protein n=1 Tax=Shimia sp. TaxID=1954381 RepID=UPI0025D126FD|nr:hypothetical protein [Shimia sp.]MCH2069423.1 hypothetical protein [Shimia sp.]
MLRFLPSKAAVWAALSAFVVVLLAWLRIDAKNDQRRKTEALRNKARLDAIQSKQEIDRDVETQDDTALIDRLTRN